MLKTINTPDILISRLSAQIPDYVIQQRDAGKAVLLVSLELSEVMNLSDRIAIINHGELIGNVKASDTNENEVGLMMAGVHKGGTKSE